MEKFKDMFIARLGGNIALLLDPELRQYILARDTRHTKSSTAFKKFAFWRDGIGHLGREVRRRQCYMRLGVDPVAVKTIPADLMALERGLPTSQERVFGYA